MLLPVVHYPGLYSRPPDDPEAARQCCGLLISLLRDAARNCVLLVDGADTMWHEMRNGLSSTRWPTNHRDEAYRLLRTLRMQNRLVSLDRTQAADELCGLPGCRVALTIAHRDGPAASIGAPQCPHCSRNKSLRPRPIDLDDYAASPFCTARQDCEILDVPYGAWSTQDFEERVWLPVFRFAKRVLIFDRIIGSQMVETGSKGARLNPKKAYAETLQWTYEAFIRLSPEHPDRLFEVTSAIDLNKASAEDAANAAEALEAFAERVSLGKPVRMRMAVGFGQERKQMRHARYLHTDQIALMIDRGFDLLTPPPNAGRIRDFYISRAPNPGQVEKEARDLVEHAREIREQMH